MAEQRGRRAVGLVTTLVWAPWTRLSGSRSKGNTAEDFFNFSSLSQTKKI